MQNLKKLTASKNSQSHIEVIISFIIFIGFIGMIFYFFSPIKQKNVSSASFDRVQEKILENVSINYNYISLILNSNPASLACFSVNNNPGITGNFIAKDFSGKIANAEKTGAGASSILKIVHSGSTFYRLYISDKFKSYPVPSAASCSELPNANYSFGAMASESIILYGNLAELENLYTADYSGLKNSLGLDSDFEFVVYDLNRSVLMNESLAKHKIKSSSVLAREILLKTINKDANQTNIILNLRVW